MMTTDRSRRTEHDPPVLSDAEVHFLWWFIQGSIINPETRERLHRAWGMCARHAIGLLQVEAAFRHGWVHASTLLYLDLLERALQALTARGLRANGRIRNRLRATGPCLMCELRARGGGAASEELLDRGRDSAELLGLAAHTRPFWLPYACRECVTGARGPLCRLHLVGHSSDVFERELHRERSDLGGVMRHLIRYARSFRWEERDSETEGDRAALMTAVGWCSGWSELDALAGAEA